MSVLDSWTETEFLRDKTIPEPVRGWLLHDIERVCDYPQWLEKSIGMSKVFPESTSPSDLLRVVDDNKKLLVCDHEDDFFCLGTVVRGFVSMIPVKLGEAAQTRFAIAISPIDGTLRNFLSTLHKSGRIAFTEYCSPTATSKLAKTVIFHRDHPGKILGAVDVAEEGFPDIWEGDSQGEHPPSFFQSLRPQQPIAETRLWSAFVAMCPSQMQGWKTLQYTTTVEGTGLPPAKQTYSVPTFSRLFFDGQDMQDIRQSYVEDLFTMALGKPRLSVECGDDRLSIESLSENSGLLESPSAPNSPKLEKSGDEQLCSECGARFKRKYELNRHFQSVHVGVRKHACDICLKYFTQASHVRVHIETVHNKTKTSECDLCGQSFGTKHKLVRHKRSVHERLRPHACTICGAAYFQNSDLRRHLKKSHETTSVR
ncbi:hypothetical protein NDN08_006064 [Rhodosorus marinus]|uniref:C2H2-type domain-containing protein n=1 Tax=Rhodosorus marinus TaxID=101924 RepID=A0AAV8UK40_9RHOD|nr:hypothetical protein NDN08_006064 [Rhodosorus marinus]